MNVETGNTKKWDDLTEEERKSGKWFQLPDGMHKREIKALSKSEKKRREYMARVAEKKKNGANF